MVHKLLISTLKSNMDDIAINIDILSEWFEITLNNDKVCLKSSQNVNDYIMYLHGLCITGNIVCWDIVDLLLGVHLEQDIHRVIYSLFEDLGLWISKYNGFKFSNFMPNFLKKSKFDNVDYIKDITNSYMMSKDMHEFKLFELLYFNVIKGEFAQKLNKHEDKKIIIKNLIIHGTTFNYHMQYKKDGEMGIIQYFKVKYNLCFSFSKIKNGIPNFIDTLLTLLAIKNSCIECLNGEKKRHMYSKLYPQTQGSRDHQQQYEENVKRYNREFSETFTKLNHYLCDYNHNITLDIHKSAKNSINLKSYDIVLDTPRMTSVRCNAETKKGSQCKKYAINNGSKCRIHQIRVPSISE